MSDALPRIHIVDDDRAGTQALRRLLTSWGMQVRTYASGQEFLSTLGDPTDAGCSIIDVQMPGMSGLEVQQHMNRAGMDLPVIIITAYEEEGVKEQALGAGAVGFLRKPFTDEALVGLIRSALQRRRKHAAIAVRPQNKKGITPGSR